MPLGPKLLEHDAPQEGIFLLIRFFHQMGWAGVVLSLIVEQDSIVLLMGQGVAWPQAIGT